VIISPHARRKIVFQKSKKIKKGQKAMTPPSRCRLSGPRLEGSDFEQLETATPLMWWE
jgi:hypothetical protein